jgi:hypothetical protein
MGENGKTWEWLIDFFKESQNQLECQAVSPVYRK